VDKNHQLLQFPIGKLKTGHPRGRDTFADQFAQPIDCASAGITCRYNVWTSLSSFAIGAMTGGAVRRKVASPRLDCLQIRLRTLCYCPRPLVQTPGTAQQEEQNDDRFVQLQCAWHRLSLDECQIAPSESSSKWEYEIKKNNGAITAGPQASSVLVQMMCRA
jgi:hypothetical protein